MDEEIIKNKIIELAKNKKHNIVISFNVDSIENDIKYNINKLCENNYIKLYDGFFKTLSFDYVIFLHNKILNDKFYPFKFTLLLSFTQILSLIELSEKYYFKNKIDKNNLTFICNLYNNNIIATKIIDFIILDLITNNYYNECFYILQQIFLHNKSFVYNHMKYIKCSSKNKLLFDNLSENLNKLIIS